MIIRLIIAAFLLWLAVMLAGCSIPPSAIVQAHATQSGAMRAVGAHIEQSNSFWK